MDPTSEVCETSLDDRSDEAAEMQPKYPWMTPTIMNVMSGTVAGNEISERSLPSMFKAWPVLLPDIHLTRSR